MTYEEYLRMCASEMKLGTRGQRVGQFYYNKLPTAVAMLLHRSKPNVDPFYNDERLEEFFQFIEENWVENNEQK